MRRSNSADAAALIAIIESRYAAGDMELVSVGIRALAKKSPGDAQAILDMLEIARRHGEMARAEAAKPNLADFIRARKLEDMEWVTSAWAEQSHAGGCDTCGVSFTLFIAQCEADLQILDEFSGSDPELYPVVRFLALPYADHPDYRQEWHQE